MTPTDMQFMAITMLILFLAAMASFVNKKFSYCLLGGILLTGLFWIDDAASRSGKVAFYGENFTKGSEIICKDDHGDPILISNINGWKIKGSYAFKRDHGIDLLENQCEIQGKTAPSVIPLSLLITAGLLALLGTGVTVMREFQKLQGGGTARNVRPTQERKEKIKKGAEEMAELYRTDPELKSMNEFVGDYKEMESSVQETPTTDPSHETPPKTDG